jgi:predicted O-methyltransferase YrrM
MLIDKVHAIVGATPHMTVRQAEHITQFIDNNNIQHILELGFRHGVSTCYMAAALSLLGDGSIVTIDLESARTAEPNIEQLLEKIGERSRVRVFYEPTSYIWRLMKFLEETTPPLFDLCYLDGAHSWFVDGFAFFLVDRLLKPGGWIIFDDLDWTYQSSPSLKNSSIVRDMPHEEKTIPQIKLVYDLLVKRHPDYHNFRVEDGWAYAQKKDRILKEYAEQKREIVVEKVVYYVGILSVAKSIFGKVNSCIRNMVRLTR